jgi:hypothetical protein
MRQDDLEINRHIRRVLVRHWIDLGRLSFRSVNGVVWLRGTLQRLLGVQEALTGSIIESIFQEIINFPGVKRIHAEFDNWRYDGTQWYSAGTPQIVRRPVSGETSQHFTIQEKEPKEPEKE